MAIPSSFHPHFWGPVASTLALISFIPRSHLWHFSNLALTFPLCSLLLLFLLLTLYFFQISPYLPLSPPISLYLPLSPLISLSLPSPHNSPSPLHAILISSFHSTPLTSPPLPSPLSLLPSLLSPITFHYHLSFQSTNQSHLYISSISSISSIFRISAVCLIYFCIFILLSFFFGYYFYYKLHIL